MLVGVTRLPCLSTVNHWFLIFVLLLLLSLPYLMSIVKNLDLLNRMELEEVGLHILYICQKVGEILLMLWRTDS
jgi:hypothetical protein